MYNDMIIKNKSHPDYRDGFLTHKRQSDILMAQPG
jgi:hypothetical protein